MRVENKSGKGPAFVELIVQQRPDKERATPRGIEHLGDGQGALGTYTSWTKWSGEAGEAF